MSEHTQPKECVVYWKESYDGMGPPEVWVKGSRNNPKSAPEVWMVELDSMLDMIERLMSPHFEVREDAGAEAITLLRAHGRLG